MEFSSSFLLLLIAAITSYAYFRTNYHRNCLILVVMYFFSSFTGYFGIMVFDYASELPFMLGENVSVEDHNSALLTFFLSMFFLLQDLT